MVVGAMWLLNCTSEIAEFIHNGVEYLWKCFFNERGQIYDKWPDWFVLFNLNIRHQNAQFIET